MNCPHCQQPLPDGQPMECPACRGSLENFSAFDARARAVRRKWWWITFWLAFFGAPAFALFGARFVPYIVIQPFWLGPLVAGYALARLFTTTVPARIVATIVFSLGVVAVYFAIVFAGCMVLSGGRL